jgi:pimeloyl-ACP methyl ester carboxylesterase
MDASTAGTFVREDTGFDSEGVRCAAWVYRPAGVFGVPDGAVRPVVVMAHGFGGDRRVRLTAFAERFAAAGYLVVLFDYRTFGDSEGRPRRMLRIRQQHDDYRAAVAFARALPDADPDRVVLWGTSLSGGHVLAVAANDPQVAAVVAQVPHVSGPASALRLPPLTALLLGVRAVADLVLARARHRPHYVTAIGSPGSGAVMTSPDALPGWARMIAESPEYVPVPGVVAARVTLAMPFYSPGRRASSVRCPVLVQIAREDAVTPPGAARRVARRVADATVREYDGGHFDPYVGERFEQVVTDQLAFLAERVPVR